MGKIYTRSGDKGITGIYGGQRVSKSDIRIETNGTIDELNVALGEVRVLLVAEHEWQPVLKEIQLNLMTAMSIIATPDDLREQNPNKLPNYLVTDIEELIDKINDENGRPQNFILPGGTILSVAFHKARVVTRKAERRLWKLNESDPVPDLILHYFNRLSDLFFVMARSVINQEGEEEIWKNFGYKKNRK